MDEARLIGAGNAMPWHLPADLAHFKRVTLGKPVLMGRRTFESIGRPLPGRDNIVVSRRANYTAPGCRVFGAPDAAVAGCRAAGAAALMVIGGAQIYAAMLAVATHLHLTRIHARFDGDTWFPQWDERQWRLHDSVPCGADERNAHAVTFQTWVRADAGRAGA